MTIEAMRVLPLPTPRAVRKQLRLGKGDTIECVYPEAPGFNAGDLFVIIRNEQGAFRRAVLPEAAQCLLARRFFGTAQAVQRELWSAVVASLK